MSESVNAGFYRSQATSLRAIARQMIDPACKLELFALAQEFEKLAQFAERDYSMVKLP